MTLTKMQAMLGVATGILLLGGAIGERAIVLERRFAALDTRLGKLESAIKALDAAQPDENYKALVKELIAKDVMSSWGPADSGKSYLRFDSATHGPMCSRNGGPEVPCEIPSNRAKSVSPLSPQRFGGNSYPADAGAAADAPAVKVPQ